jgi:NAD(P)-dependent dehydrogenase (short-subunit alcohol dehydrogenase family)
VVGLSKSSGVEYASQGIRANAVCPGWVATPMTAEYGSDPERRKLIVESAPIHPTSQPEEIANTIVWLCSDAASFITGDAIAVDGGQTA